MIRQVAAEGLRLLLAIACAVLMAVVAYLYAAPEAEPTMTRDGERALCARCTR